MFSNGNFDNALQSFASQFEPNGDLIFYRKNRTAAPIETSTEERDRLIRQYGRRHKALIGVLMGVMMLIIVGGALFSTFRDPSLPAPLVGGVGFALALTAFSLANAWAWNAPVRLLSNRPTSGPALSTAESQHVAICRLTWSRIGLAAAMGLFILMLVDWRQLSSGSNLARLLIAAFLLGLSLFQAARKLLAR
jgi:hypothetical protein